MNKITYNLVYNRKRCLNKNGTALVQVEAYLNKKKIFFSTNVYLRPEQWDANRQLIKNHPNTDALNRMIHEYMATIERQELEFWRQGKPITLNALKDVICRGKDECNDSLFLPFVEQEINTSGLKESTKRNHLSTVTLLRSFKGDATFAEVTFQFVSSFEYYLQSKGYHVNTIAKHMKHLKRHINTAINKDYMSLQQYAFRKYKIKSIEHEHTYLSPCELEALETLNLNGRHSKLQQSLDAFLFCCYAGLRYSDFVNLNTENIVEINQKCWLVYKSVKTNNEVRLPLYLLFGGKGISILSKYQADINEFFKLKDNSNVNKKLAIIARLAGLSKNISFHTARHTNATLLIYNGVNITTVQKLLGHKSVKTTQIYTNIMDGTIINDLERNQQPPIL